MTKAKTKDYMSMDGWGIDADPENHPAYPMRDRTHEDEETTRPPQQETTVELLKSNERPIISAVFGTTAPPKGLSGMVRRRAFKYSESHLAHWFLLMFADRINMVEGIFEDMRRGKIPNLLSEMGLKSEWKYNRAHAARNAAVMGGLALGAYMLLKSRK
jgi:hypothetical protein